MVFFAGDGILFLSFYGNVFFTLGGASGRHLMLKERLYVYIEGNSAQED
jgi:hypothetical protein